MGPSINDTDTSKANATETDYVELVSSSSHPRRRDGAYRMDSATKAPASKDTDLGTVDDGGEREPDTLPLWTAVKRYPKVVAYCVAMAIPVVSYGYDQVIVGAVPGVDSFKAAYGEMIDGEMAIPGAWLSLFIGLAPAGSALGSISAGWLQDIVGRKFALMIGSVISAVSICLIFFSHYGATVDSKRSLFTAGITIQGYSVGIIKIVCLTYISENAPTAIRGSALALLPTFNLVGQLIGSLLLFGINSMDGPNGYLGSFGSQWILALLSFGLSCIMPESPSYHLRKDNVEKAHHAAKRLFAPKVDPSVVVRMYREVIEEEKALYSGIGWRVLVQGTNLRRTLIIMLTNVTQAMFGLDLLANGSVFLQTTGVDSSIALLLLVVGIVLGMLGNATGLWILSRVGRRPATIVTMTAAGLLWGGMGIAGFWRNDAAAYWSAAAMMLITVTVSLGAWPASYAIMGETSELRLRSKSQAAGGVLQQLTSVVMGLILPYIFSPDEGNLRGRTGFVYTGLCFLGALMVWLWVPEMKGRSALEIDHMFELKLPTRKFKTWRMPEDETLVDEARGQADAAPRQNEGVAS